MKSGEQEQTGQEDIMAFQVLLIEDNRIDANLTSRSLNEFAVSAGIRFDIIVFAEGELALDYLYCRGTYANRGRTNPDLILLDLKLPGIDGFEVLEKIKSTPSTKSIPVVVFTVHGDEQSINRCLELKADDFMQKPFSGKDFKTTLCQLQNNWILPRL